MIIVTNTIVKPSWIYIVKESNENKNKNVWLNHSLRKGYDSGGPFWEHIYYK